MRICMTSRKFHWKNNWLITKKICSVNPHFCLYLDSSTLKLMQLVCLMYTHLDQHSELRTPTLLDICVSSGWLNLKFVSPLSMTIWIALRTILSFALNMWLRTTWMISSSLRSMRQGLQKRKTKKSKPLWSTDFKPLSTLLSNVLNTLKPLKSWKRTSKKRRPNSNSKLNGVSIWRQSMRSSWLIKSSTVLSLYITIPRTLRLSTWKWTKIRRLFKLWTFSCLLLVKLLVGPLERTTLSF